MKRKNITNDDITENSEQSRTIADTRGYAEKLKRLIFDSKYRFDYLAEKGFTNFIPDDKYIKILFKKRMGYGLDLRNPKSFNEKLNWLKLNDHNPLYASLVDKSEVKNYITRKIGAEYVIPTIGIWERFDDIDFGQLPDQFVLKCTHDSGGLVIVKEKKNFEKEAAKKKIERALGRNYYYLGREWPYKNVKPRIMAEEYMADESGNELRDYKFFCFNGEMKCFKVDYDRFTAHRANYYSKSKVILDFGESLFPPDLSREIIMPSNIDQMIALAEELSRGFRFLRVDFYNVYGKIFFGELTFYPNSGFGKFSPKEWDYILGEWLDLGR